MIILKTNGIFNYDGEIVLNSLKTILWESLSDNNPPKLPAGTSVALSISLDENIFLTGINGIVWATYDSRQAEIIQNTLIALHINTEIMSIDLVNKFLFLIKILDDKDLNEVMEFIWKSDSGLRLKPDWNYPEGETNKSFELWLNGQ